MKNLAFFLIILFTLGSCATTSLNLKNAQALGEAQNIIDNFYDIYIVCYDMCYDSLDLLDVDNTHFFLRNITAELINAKINYNSVKKYYKKLCSLKPSDKLINYFEAHGYNAKNTLRQVLIIESIYEYLLYEKVFSKEKLDDVNVLIWALREINSHSNNDIRNLEDYKKLRKLFDPADIAFVNSNFEIYADLINYAFYIGFRISE
jgi:hypothetical protein